jgi:GxxExxY protein
MDDELIYPEESYAIMGACFDVYSERGCGFLEPVYQECLEIEFKLRGIPAVPKPKLSLTYKGHSLKQHYEPDFVCYGKIIIELKAVGAIANEHRAQVINYLHATGFKLGILINFGSNPRLDWERLANTKLHKPLPPRLVS